MKLIDNIVNGIKMGGRGANEVDEGYYDDEEDYEEEQEEPETPVKSNISKFDGSSRTSTKESQPATTTTTTSRKSDMNQLCVFKPKSFDEASEIVSTLKTGRPIFLNFEGVEISISQRVLDIVTGACLALDGNLQKISNYIFIATPKNVEVAGDFQDNLTGVFNSL